MLGRGGGRGQIDRYGRRDGGFGGREELRERFAECRYGDVPLCCRGPGLPRVEAVIPPARPEVVPREIASGIAKHAVGGAGAVLQEVEAVVARHQKSAVAVTADGV